LPGAQQVAPPQQPRGLGLTPRDQQGQQATQ
jgi:hypothetical protein